MVQPAAKISWGPILALPLLLGACGDSGSLSTGSARAPEASSDPQIEAPAPPSEAPATARGNSPPTLGFLDFQPREPRGADEVLKVVFEASDEDGDTLFFHYQWSVDWEPAGDGTDQLSLAGIERGQRIEVRVVVNDGKQESPPESRSTRLGNSPPKIVEITTDFPDAIVANAEIVAQTQATDRDGDPLRFRYQWKINGRSLHETSSKLVARRVRRGDEIQVTVVASDGDSESEPKASPVWIAANSEPEIVSVPGEFSSDGVFRYAVEINDPDGDRRFSLHLEEAPEGMDIDPGSSTVSWAPSTEQAGAHTFLVVADDGHGGIARQQVEVRVGEPQDASPAALAQ
jgi:hypothetical protein